MPPKTYSSFRCPAYSEILIKFTRGFLCEKLYQMKSEYYLFHALTFLSFTVCLKYAFVYMLMMLLVTQSCQKYVLIGLIESIETLNGGAASAEDDRSEASGAYESSHTRHRPQREASASSESAGPAEAKYTQDQVTLVRK